VQGRVLVISCMRVNAKYSHNHSEEAAACNLYKLHDSGERMFSHQTHGSQKVNGVNVQKDVQLV